MGQHSPRGFFLLSLLKSGWVSDFTEALTSHFPRVFCKRLATAFWLPAVPGLPAAPSPARSLAPISFPQGWERALSVQWLAHKWSLSQLLFSLWETAPLIVTDFFVYFIWEQVTPTKKRDCSKELTRKLSQKQVKLKAHHASFPDVWSISG